MLNRDLKLSFNLDTRCGADKLWSRPSLSQRAASLQSIAVAQRNPIEKSGPRHCQNAAVDTELTRLQQMCRRG